MHSTLRQHLRVSRRISGHISQEAMTDHAAEGRVGLADVLGQLVQHFVRSSLDNFFHRLVARAERIEVHLARQRFLTGPLRATQRRELLIRRDRPHRDHVLCVSERRQTTHDERVRVRVRRIQEHAPVEDSPSGTRVRSSRCPLREPWQATYSAREVPAHA